MSSARRHEAPKEPRSSATKKSAGGKGGGEPLPGETADSLSLYCFVSQVNPAASFRHLVPARS